MARPTWIDKQAVSAHLILGSTSQAPRNRNDRPDTHTRLELVAILEVAQRLGSIRTGPRGSAERVTSL
jgi:hypothetical protein